MMARTASTRERLADQDLRVEQHADRDEEQHREGVLQRQRLGGGAVAQLRLAQHHAGEEGAEREGDAEQLGRAVGDTDRGRDHAEGEELARARAGHLPEEPGEEAAADDEHERDEGRDLGERQAEDREQPLLSGAGRHGRQAPPSQWRRAAAAAPGRGPSPGPRPPASRPRCGR